MIARYKKSVEPVYTDGRDIDRDVAELSGEAANQQASGSTDEHLGKKAQVWQKTPDSRVSDPTYYDRPLLNEPVWEWAVPLYYYVGGLSGASLVLASAARACGAKATTPLVRRCYVTGLVGACAGGALLTYDLGRPWRFFNMLRVFRPTSPMNVGAWILSGAIATSMPAVLLGERRGAAGTAGAACGFAAGVFGMGLATYTGVLLANSAVPLWQESRRMLPVLFGFSAMASTGSAFAMLGNSSAERIPQVFGTIGQLVEVTAAGVMERQVSVVPRVGRPLKKGLSGLMWRSATALTVSSVILGFVAKGCKKKRVAAGVLGTLGSLLMRFAVERAGVVSARDARASFHQQRAGHGAAEVIRSAQAT